MLWDIAFVHELLSTSKLRCVFRAFLPFEVMIKSGERSAFVVKEANQKFTFQHFLGCKVRIIETDCELNTSKTCEIKSNT